MSRYGWGPYVSVAERRRKAEREMDKLRKKGHPVAPVVIEGRVIARTFWGKAWCANLESYSDLSNRVPRGRTYVRNGSVVDLQVAPGVVSALVRGSRMYRVSVKVSSLPKARWASICVDCAGEVDSLVELLQGRFSKGVMDRICRQTTGLFPAPSEIRFSCSCPDWADMCKHVAAVLYGIGARLDERPELLFTFRQVDGKDLIAHAGKAIPLSKKGPANDRILAEDDLSKLFGLEMGKSGDDPLPGARVQSGQKNDKAGLVKVLPTVEKTVNGAKPVGRRISRAKRKKAPTSKAKPKPVKGKGRSAAKR